MDMNTQLTDEEIGQIIDNAILNKSRQVFMSTADKLMLRQELFNSIRRLDLLQELIDDPDITEVMVNGPDSIFYEKNGRIYTWDRHFESREKLENVIRQIVSRANRQVNERSPIVDARLMDGSRVNVVLDPVAINGQILTIRKFPEERITMDNLVRWGSLGEDAADYLRCLVRARYNIFICGATSSGKTTFLNALTDYIPKGERVIVIEDSRELALPGIEDLVQMECHTANAQGSGEVTMDMLIRTSLRMRPDRIIVGEVRGAEALDMIQAMNTGADGSMSTGHANSPLDMLRRLETMILMDNDIPLRALRSQIASSIDVIVHLGRLRDKSRRVLEITEILDLQDGEYRLNPLFVFRENRHKPDGGDGMLHEQTAYGKMAERVDGALVRTDNHLHNRRKLAVAAIDRTDL